MDVMKHRGQIVLVIVVLLIIFNVQVYAGTHVEVLPATGLIAHVDFFLDAYAIDWGVCYTSETTNRTLLVTNNGTVPHTLIIFSANWTVTESCFLFSSPQNLSVVDVDEQLNVTLSLRPLPCAADFKNFSFNIYLWALG
jgi:hypothetical protein